MVQLRGLAQLLDACRRRRLAVEAERSEARVLERRDLVGDAVRGLDSVVLERVRRAGTRGGREYDGVDRVHRHVRLEVVERRQEEARRREVRARVRRVLCLWLRAHVSKATEVEGGRNSRDGAYRR